MSVRWYPEIDVIEADPITTPDGITYEIDWDDDRPFVPAKAEDTLRWFER